VYVCALRPLGEPLDRTDVFGYIARLDRSAEDTLQSIVDGPFAAVAVQRPDELRPQIARWRHLIGAGDVRLDNPGEIARLAGVKLGDVESDLQLVLAALDQVGEACVRPLLGDFAFVAWDARAQKLIAVRDAFGVKPLFRTSTTDLELFSSEIRPLRRQDEYDLEFIAAYLSGQGVVADRTVWREVGTVPPASLLRQRGTVQTVERFWRPEEFPPAETGDEEANCAEFRALLERGIEARLHGAGEVWAQLSGGLDSSSVVALAHRASVRGGRLAGTVTMVDSMGEGDERVYSDAVVQRFGIRNEQVHDYWPWQDDGEAPPLTDQPTPMYPFFARERRVLRLAQNAGARVMLSGLGADHYLWGSLDYITDLVSARRFSDAISEITTWSVATRQSFWTLGRQYLVDPFFSRGPAAAPPLPEWAARRGLSVPAPHMGAPRAGARFAHSVASAVAALPRWMERFPAGETLEMRYPFLYRPLVELSLQLPARQRVRPRERKWILRQATRDVLPEIVRTRSSKGGIDARVLWSLQRERQRIDVLMKDPVLGQLGCIDVPRLRAAVDDARRGVPVHNVHLFSTLSLETWLAVQSGSWTAQRTPSASAA
jgi:asparagine synthase (glutamine-hydrolysing)